MSTADPLAALLLREGVLPPPRVDEAQERMVLFGGTLDSALLELGYLDERRLLELLARAYNARAVDTEELRAIDKGVTSLFPRRLAEKHGVVPLDVSGRRLTLALAGPPDLALLDEIGFMLSVYVKPAVTTQARVSWALAAYYGVPLPARMEALLARVGGRPEEAKAAVDAWQTRVTHTKKPPPPSAAPAAPASAAPPAVLSTPPSDAALPTTVPSPAPPSEPALAASMARDAAAVPGEAVTTTTAKPAKPMSKWANDAWLVAEAAALPREGTTKPQLEIVDGGLIEAEAVAGEIAREAARPDPDRERTERRRKERVMWTVDDAIAELALAEERDDMLDVVLRFAYRRLSTVCIFILGGRQSFAAWDLIDPLLERRDIASFAIPAEGKNALAQVKEMLSPFLGPLKPDDPLVRLFGRRARAVVLVPIQVGDRFIGVLYGDAGTRSIPPSSMAELHMVVPRLGKGLGNLILRKKKALRATAAVGEPAKPAVVLGRLVNVDDEEEVIAVAKKAPSRHLPTIDIDISELEPIEAPTSLSSELPDAPPAPPALALPPALPSAPRIARPISSPLPPEPTPMPWADGKGDDEDVRLDEHAMQALEGAPAASRSAPIELPLDDNAPLASDDDVIAADDVPPDGEAADLAPARNDGAADAVSAADVAPGRGAHAVVDVAPGRDHAVVDVEPGRGGHAVADVAPSHGVEAADRVPGWTQADEVVDAAELVRGGSEHTDVVDAAELVRGRSGPAAVVDAAELAPDRSARGALDDDELALRALVSTPAHDVDSAVAASPGASARESILVATHAFWLAHDDPELDELVGQMHRPGDKERKAAVAAVVAHGVRALPSLARYFPGVLTVHPFGSMAGRPDVPELSDCLACMSKLGADQCAPILVGELGHDDRLHRWSAVWALSSLRVPGALPRLAQRVFDPEPSIAALAIEILDGYRSDAAFDKVLAQVRDLVRRGDSFERERAIAAVGELRDRESLPALVDLIGTRPKEIADEARRALVEITKQDFGSAERRWRAWIADNDKTPRTRWLIEGLAAKDDEIRRSAQSELNRATGQFFGYRWDAPRSEREASLSQWNEWWQGQERDAPGRWP